MERHTRRSLLGAGVGLLASVAGCSTTVDRGAPARSTTRSDTPSPSRWRLEFDGGIDRMAVDGETLYVGAGSLDAVRDGQRRWSFDPGSPIAYGPVVDGETMYVFHGERTGGAVDGALAAVSTGGAGRWRYDGGTFPGYPATITPLDEELYVLISGGDAGRDTLYRLDAGGFERWTYDANAIGGVAVDRYSVYVETGDGLVAVNRFVGNERWRVATGGSLLGVHGETAYVLENSRLVGFAGGELAWQLGIDGREIESGRMVGDDVYLVTVPDGPAESVARRRLHMVDLSWMGQRWYRNVGRGSLSLATGGDALYVGLSPPPEADVTGRVYSLHAPSGRKRWGSRLEYLRPGSLVAADDALYAVAERAPAFRAVSLDADGGRRRWQFPVRTSITGLAAGEERAYVGTEGGTVHALRR